MGNDNSLNEEDIKVYNAVDNYLKSVKYFGITSSKNDKLNKSRAFTCWYIEKEWGELIKNNDAKPMDFVVDGANDNKIDALITINDDYEQPHHKMYFIQSKYYSTKITIDELRDIKELLSNVNDINSGDDNFISPNEDLAKRQKEIKEFLNYSNCEIHFVFLTTSKLEGIQEKRWNAFVSGRNLSLLSKDDDNYDDDSITGEVKDLLIQLRKNHKSVSLDLVDLNELKRLGYVVIE